MCLAIPALLVEKRPHDQALVELGGIRKPVSIALVPEAQVGDYVIVHVGHAIGLTHSDRCDDVMTLAADCPPIAPALLPIEPTPNDLQRCRSSYRTRPATSDDRPR